MKSTAKFSAYSLVGFLLASLCFNAFPQTNVNLASAISTLPVDGKEYTEGSIIQENSPLLIWYDWVDVSRTQVVYYGIYTSPDYPFPVPIANIVGQHFQLADGTQVFIASALSELEVYRDLNGDGIPQADFAAGESEILYNMYVNMSDGFSMTPIQKVTEDAVPHYHWSFTYENAHGYLQDAAARLSVAVSLIFSHITLSYDFSVNGNVSNLKTSFDIGKVTNLSVLDSSNFTLDGLSLDLLYATATYTSKPYTTYVDGQKYNSTTAENPALDAELAQVQVGGVQAYDFVFGGNYTLTRGENNETYQLKAEAAALSSLPPIFRINPIPSMGFFRDELNLLDLFGGSWQSFDMNYENSSLIYRICFPAWNGLQIQNDPVYVGYLLSKPDSEKGTEFPTTLALSAIAAIVVAIVVLYVILRKHR